MSAFSLEMEKRIEDIVLRIDNLKNLFPSRRQIQAEIGHHDHLSAFSDFCAIVANKIIYALQNVFCEWIELPADFSQKKDQRTLETKFEERSLRITTTKKSVFDTDFVRFPTQNIFGISRFPESESDTPPNDHNLQKDWKRVQIKNLEKLSKDDVTKTKTEEEPKPSISIFQNWKPKEAFASKKEKTITKQHFSVSSSLAWEVNANLHYPRNSLAFEKTWSDLFEQQIAIFREKTSTSQENPKRGQCECECGLPEHPFFVVGVDLEWTPSLKDLPSPTLGTIQLSFLENLPTKPVKPMKPMKPSEQKKEKKDASSDPPKISVLIYHQSAFRFQNKIRFESSNSKERKSFHVSRSLKSFFACSRIGKLFYGLENDVIRLYDVGFVTLNSCYDVQKNPAGPCGTSLVKCYKNLFKQDFCKSKRICCSNWSMNKTELSSAQLRYALRDVVAIIAIYSFLCQKAGKSIADESYFTTLCAENSVCATFSEDEDNIYSSDFDSRFDLSWKDGLEYRRFDRFI